MQKMQRPESIWLSAANAGYIAGFLAGPPCETWSVARGRKLDVKEGAQRRAPRILRTAEHLWGLPSLALKEFEQILANRELSPHFLTVDGEYKCLRTPGRAAIWKLPVVQALLQAPGLRRHRVSQGLYGAPSPKPTDLLVTNLPDLPMAFREWLLRADMPKGASIGLTSDGFWQTGIGFDSLCVAQVAEPPAEDIARWRSMNQTEHSRHLGQDFAA